MKLANNTLRVHTVNGQLWYQALAPEPKLYAGTLEAFLEDSLQSEYARVRMIGSRANARLITMLHEAARDVEVCTPAIVAKRSDRNKPGPVLFELGLCAWSPSQGGFHKVVDADYRAYKMATATTPLLLDEYLLQHPGWPALSFIKTIDKSHVATLLMYLLDPRWYIDPCYPDSGAKFREACGLTPYIFKDLFGNKAYRETPQHLAAARTLASWKDISRVGDVCSIYDLTGPICVPDSDKLGIAPCDFCWRIWAMDNDNIKASLRASQRFADFLRQTWLDAIYRGAAATPDARAGLFRPADFFERDAEAHAYERHIAQFSTTPGG